MKWIDHCIDVAAREAWSVGTHRAYAQRYRDYSEMCTRAGLPAQPFTYQKVARYLLFFFISRKTPHGRSLPAVVSSLRGVASSMQVEFLPIAANKRLSLLVKGLINLGVSHVRRAVALVLELIMRFATAAPMSTLRDLQWLTRCLVAHMAMLRLDDHRDGLLRKHHVEWLPSGSAILWVPPGKNKRRGKADGPQRELQPANLFNAFAFGSAGASLEEYWAAIDFSGQPPDAFLFPFIRADMSVDWSRCMSDADWMAETHRRAVLIGLPPDTVEHITGHSFRAGGVTDFLLARIPHAFIMRQGRWLSTAFMVYFRLSRAALAIMSAAMFKSLVLDAAARSEGALSTSVPITKRRLFQ